MVLKQVPGKVDVPIEHKNGDDQRYDDDDDGDNGMVVMMVLQEEAPGRSDY